MSSRSLNPPLKLPGQGSVSGVILEAWSEAVVVAKTKLDIGAFAERSAYAKVICVFKKFVAFDNDGVWVRASGN
ncbi:MAG: hypothetical protein V4485_00840 [Pseudomonadota bacterium]